MNIESFTQQFDGVYEECSDLIFRHLYFRLRDRARALELTQEVFARYWQTLLAGKTIEFPKAFLYRSATNAFINEIRTGRRTVSFDRLREVGFDIEYDEKEKEALEAQQEVVERLKDLDERYREILTLRYIDDMAVKDIARMLGKSENYISVQIKRGLEKLKKTYG